MTKNKKIILVLLLATIVSIAGGYLVYKAFTNQKTTIYVFNGDYVAGTTITSDMITTIECDKDIVVSNKRLTPEVYSYQQQSRWERLSEIA